MADEPVMTPIAPEEGGAIPPKANPFGAAPSPTPVPAPAAPAPAAPVAAAPAPAAPKPVASSAGVSTIRLKPVIRRPMIRKPTVGGARPPVVPAVAKPAAAPAPAAAAAPAAGNAAKKSTQNLKSVTGPIPAQAVLRKTGIIAEGILTPAQQQAAKSKTSRISLESAIGVAPVSESASAPLKTIRLRRPTDLKPQPLKPAAAVPSPIAPAAPAAPAAEPAPADGAPAAEEASATQKKTLKLHRPSVGIKRPTMVSSSVQNPAAEGGDVPEIADIPDIPDIGSFDTGASSRGGGSAGVPGWISALSLVTALAALLVIGALTYFLYQEGMGPAAGTEATANEMRIL